MVKFTMGFIQVECSKCKVREKCPKQGSSPLMLNKGKRILCRIIGGYGRIPVDRSILSEESREKSTKDGPCLTIAEVPVLDKDTGNITFQVTKIFSDPILHDREKVKFNINLLTPKSGGE